MFRFAGWMACLICPLALLFDGISAAEPLPMDWSQFKAEPEPSTAATLREKFLAHLARVDRSLAEMRAALRQPKSHRSAGRLGPNECFARIDGACSFVSSSNHAPEIVSDLGSIDELIRSLGRAKDIADQARDGAEMTPEKSRALQSAHGLVKTVRRHLKTLAANAKAESVELDSSERRAQPRCGGPALIVRPTADLIPARAHLEYPIGAVLWRLATLTTEQRIEFMRTIVEDEHTRLLDMLIEPDCDPSSPSFFLLVAKDIELPDGNVQTVQLPFRATFERRGTNGWANVLRILTNTSSDAELTVRNTLLTEIPVTKELSITACETATTFRPASDAEHPGGAVIVFAGDVELTFYGRLSSRIRDVSFRSVAVSKSSVSMERSNARSVAKTRDELTRMLAATVRQSPSPKMLAR